MKKEPDGRNSRVLFSMTGLTPNVAAIPDFEKDWDTIMKKVSPGWTILANLMDMKPHPPDVEALNVKVQQKILQKGCRKVAQVAPILVVTHINKFSEKSGLKDILRGFNLEHSIFSTVMLMIMECVALLFTTKKPRIG